MSKSTARRQGATSKGKGAGVGSLTNLRRRLVGENQVLSNRDKSRHSRTRGQDSKWVETEQLQDHQDNRDPD
jgi:hypothetical protein